jgi:hypothetical protein
MSKTLTLDEVIAIVNRQKLSPVDTQAIVRELNARAQAKEADKEPGEPKAKNQLVVLATSDRSFGWVLQIPEDASPMSVVDRVNAAAHSFNASKRGRLLPVKNVGETLESVPRKHWKEAGQGTVVKTKLMVPIIVTDNVLSQPPSV